jgi:23S rRNA (guanosine2251-2'-O)-methyltransferase
MSEQDERDAAEGTRRIAGRKPVRDALDGESAALEKILIAQSAGGPAIREIESAADQASVQVQHVPPERMRHEAGELHHQGVLARAAPVAYRDLDDVLSGIAPTWDDVQQRRPLLLVIDRITDPRNYGAVLRSAVAAGAAAAIVPSRHMAPLSAVALRASAGTARRLPIARTGDLPRALQQLKERGYFVFGADAAASETPLWQADVARPLALVLGSEGEGLRPDVADACDEFIHIPMPGAAESLNASVAAGVLLFEAVRARESDRSTENTSSVE